MDEESRELMDIFMQSDAADSVSQRAVEDTGLANYGQPYGSPIATMPMQSSHSQQSTAFHSMNPTQMMPQDLSPTLMPSDVMMQSPQQQQQHRYPQQHMGYGNGSYNAYSTGYTGQRSLSQSQLSPAAAYHGSFQQDGGFMSSKPDFSPTSPTNQGMAALRSPGVPGAMNSSQSMYYSGNSPYRGNPPISPMAPQGGFAGIPTSSSLPASNLPQMNPEQPFFPSSFPSQSPTQKKMQSNVMANFFQSPLQQPMPAPIRPHQAHAGNIPQQTVASPVSQTFPQDMAMYTTMPQDSFQQMTPFTSTGPGAQLYQQRSCMYADRSASNALQQLYQAQQLKTQGGSRTARRASYPGPANHTLPKSPNQRSTSSPRSTPSPKVRSPLPSSMPSPPARQKAPGKVPSPNQNPGQLNRDAFPLSPPTLPPQNQATEQNTGLPNRGNELATPQVNVKKEKAKMSPPSMQTTSPGTDNAVKGNVETAHCTKSSPPAESSPANQKLPSNISPEADSTKKSARAPSADKSGSAKSADSEVCTGDARSTEEVNGEKPHQHGCEAEEEKAADSKAVADVASGKTENKGEKNSDQDSNVQTTEEAGRKEGQGVEAAKEVSEEHAHAKNGVVPPKGSSVGEAAKPGGLVAKPDAVRSLEEGQTVSSDSQRSTEGVSDLLCGDENLKEELASSKQEEVSVSDLQSYEKLTEDVASPVKEEDKASDLPAEKVADASASPKEQKVTACDPQSSEKASGIPKEKVAENPTKDSPSAMVKTDQTSDLQSSDNASASTKEEKVTASNSPHAEKLTEHSTSPEEKKGEASLNVTKEEEEGKGEEKEERRFSSESQSTQTTQLPKPTPRPVSGQPTTTITAKIIAKGHSAHSNQEVVVAKTPGGQMYLIQGNMLVPVHNITVQEDKDGQGPKVIVVNPSRTATPLKFSNLVTQTPIKTEETKGVVSVTKKSPEKSTEAVAGKDKRSPELSDRSGTNAGTGAESPIKKRIGRPPGSKDKQKRKSHGHKRKFLESPPPKQTPTKFARTVNAIKETKAASSGERRPANKRALEVPTIRKSGHVSKRHKSGTSHSTVRHISVKPRGGVDGDAWVCSLCGKAVNENFLGTLYGPYMARLSRERTDSTSKECKSPTKLTSPVRQDPTSVEGSLEAESNSVELWVHKDCAVWSHGVFMLGRTLHGLEQAVESAASHKCSQCSELGATLACFKRGCEKIFHFACARDSGSSFNEENYTILCSSHKET